MALNDMRGDVDPEYARRFRMKRARPGMGDVRSSPNDQVDPPRVGMGDVRASPNDRVPAPAYDYNQSYAGPASTYAQAPMGAATPEELMAIKRASMLRNIQARGDQRVARAGAWQTLTNPNATPMDRAAAFANRDVAEARANFAQGDYNRDANVGRRYLSPEQVAANRDALVGQFAANTGKAGTQIPSPMDPVANARAFFLGNGAERYQGAGGVAQDLAHAGYATRDLNADQNRPRTIQFDPYMQPTAPGMGSENDPDSMASRLMTMRRGRELARAMAGNEAQTMLNESELGPVDSGARLALGRGRLGMVPKALEAEGAGLDSAIAKGGSDVAGYKNQKAAYEGGTDVDSMERKVQQLKIGQEQQKAATSSALGSQGIGNVGDFTNTMNELTTGVLGAHGPFTSQQEVDAAFNAYDNIVIKKLNSLKQQGPEGAQMARDLANLALMRLKMPFTLNFAHKRGIQARRDLLMQIAGE